MDVKDIEKRLVELLSREMPAGTIIGNPAWWAKRISHLVYYHTGGRSPNTKPTSPDYPPGSLVIESYPRHTPWDTPAVGIMITHSPTGATVICQHHRSSHSNRDCAMRAIRALFAEGSEE